jgi:serine/threonine protein kinase
LNLAIDEFRAYRTAKPDLDLDQHCRRFREFGSSIERSIFRQLETQRFIDDHPELMELFHEPRWPEVGEEVDGFAVLEELGRGAAARVYLCRQGEIGDRQVVLKLTPYKGFEASILGRLNHPNIIPIHSTGAVDERQLHYLCMPYCGRSTLTDLLDHAFREGPPLRDSVILEAANRWAPDGAGQGTAASRTRLGKHAGRTYLGGVVRLGIQIADALDHAHRQCVLHGDLKPSNVLLTREGRPLLLDFNLSQDFSIAAGICGGTLPYMPPEHLRQVAQQQPDEQDGRVFDPKPDIYSFGALMYELLTGSPPVDLPRQLSSPEEIAPFLLKKLQTGVPPIRGRNPLVGKRLQASIQQCLAFDPGARPESMSEVKRALVEETRWMPSLKRQIRARPVASTLILGSLAAAGVCIFAYLLTRPLLHETRFDLGMAYYAAGEFGRAAESFAEAVKADPDFASARFELGRSRIAAGDYDLAISAFDPLARTLKQPLSMAYLGYCFNLKGLHVAAIPWYERAIRRGVESAAIYNNLGASLLAASSTLPTPVRYERAEQCLTQALKLDDNSSTIRLNLVRLELAKALRDPSHQPVAAWPHIQAMLKSAPDDPIVRAHAATWYTALGELESLPAGAAINSLWTSLELERRTARAPLQPGAERRMLPVQLLTSQDGDGGRTDEPVAAPPVGFYFIEPSAVVSSAAS